MSKRWQLAVCSIARPKQDTDCKALKYSLFWLFITITECEKCQKHYVAIIACITAGNRISTTIIHNILSYLDKQGSPITGNNTRAPPLEALKQTIMFDDFIIQRDFDFGA